MILVTGGTGLVGSHLLYHLCNQGIACRALRRSSSDIEAVKVLFSYYTNDAQRLLSLIEWVEGDLLEYETLNDALVGVSKIYNCAGSVYAPADQHDEMLAVNVEGTANLVNAAIERNNGIKICHVSSIAALGEAKNGKLITEDNFWQRSNATNDYGLSKYLGEKEVWRAAEEGLNVVIVNPSVILGPGNWKRGSSALIAQCAKGIPYYTSGGTGFVAVQDVVVIMQQLMEGHYKSERFILNSENWTYKNFFDVGQGYFGHRKSWLKIGKNASEIIWRIEWLKSFFGKKHPLITRATAVTAQNLKLYSNEKVKNRLNYQFEPVHLALERICKQYAVWHQ